MVYPPQFWKRDANERRLRLLRGITARLLAKQRGDWRWVVMLHREDPLAVERVRAVRGADPRAVVLYFNGAVPTDRQAFLRAIAHQGWRGACAAGKGPVLTTRVDDDDGFAPDALPRLRAAVVRAGFQRRRAWLFPHGYRVWKGRSTFVRHVTNAWSSVLSPAGDPFVIFETNHNRIADVAPVSFVDERPGWLWVRHPDTISGGRTADVPISAALRSLFPIDWKLVG